MHPTASASAGWDLQAEFDTAQVLNFFEIDALWERERVAVELDRRTIHGTRKKFESDRRRDRILIAEGRRTIRITWRQLQEEPEEIAADLRAALKRPGSAQGAEGALGRGHHPRPPGK